VYRTLGAAPLACRGIVCAMAERATWQRAADASRRIGHAVEAHGRIGSTNDRARALAAEGRTGVAIVAEEQSAGRGRRGRTWSSPPGVNLMVSVAIRPHLVAADAWQLGLAAALAARSACATVAPVEVKWPNDLVSLDGRKVGGLLVETALDGEAVTLAVIGIGINVNWPRTELPEEIRDSATSLLAETGEPVDRVALLARLLAALDAEIGAVEAGRSPLPRYRSACRTLGAEVVVAAAGEEVIGRAVDLDATGGLVVETRSGARTIASGEVVRVRPAVPA
jgi:BirA family biotin operon repressor/biotin-[acetyl-CoA-carboxylase] ligase